MSWLLDFVPIVGTIKNTFECVECVAHGDGTGALRKGAQSLIGGALDVATFGTSGAVAKVLAKGVAKQVATKAVERTGTTLAVNCAVRCATGAVLPDPECHRGFRRMNVHREWTDTRRSTGECKRTRQGSGESGSERKHYGTEISYEELARSRNERNPPEKPRQEKDPSDRGEHVINNNVLRFNRDVVNTFVRNVLQDDLNEMINSGRLSTRSRVYQAINRPVPERIAEMIQNQLVVHLNGRYFDRNADAYGRQIQLLRGVIGSYMNAINAALDDANHSDMLPALERNVRDAVYDFLAGGYYVDEHALKIWRKKHGMSTKFDESKAAVEKMFKSLIYDGVNDTLIQ